MARPRKVDNYYSTPVRKALKELGASLNLARRKRKISIRNFAERIMVSPTTAIKILKGDPSVNLGAFVTALWIMGMHRKVLDAVAVSNDLVGLAEDAKRLPLRIRQNKKVTDGLDF